MNGNIPKPYDASAQYSDFVYEQCFGATGQRLNDEVVRVVKKLMPQPSRILEAGAGTGGLTIPLAEAGQTVTTVDQSPGMLAQLERKLALLPLETRARVTVRPPVRIERYRLREQRYDLVLCVVTVLNHLLKEADLKAFAQSAFRRLLLIRLFQQEPIHCGQHRRGSTAYTCLLKQPDKQKASKARGFAPVRHGHRASTRVWHHSRACREDRDI